MTSVIDPGAGHAPGPTWRNWAGTVESTAAHVHDPRDEAEVALLVRRAAAEGVGVRAVGSGHSFPPVADVPGGHLLRLGNLAGIRRVDGHHVTVGAGTVLADLNAALRSCGLALANLGDIDRQTVAGAVATGTHGTGAGFRAIHDGIEAMRLVTATGEIVVVDGHDLDLRAAARVSLGALGIVTEVTFHCVPAFDLHALEAPVLLDDLLAVWDEAVDACDHVEFYWCPGTEWAFVKANSRNAPGAWQPPMPAPGVRIDPDALGILGLLGRWQPDPDAPDRPHVHRFDGPSHAVFCSERDIPFVESELAAPLADGVAAVRAVRHVVAAHPEWDVRWPVEVRVLGADDAPLSMASGRASTFVAVHEWADGRHGPYFDAVAAALAPFSPRPHWGKLHPWTAAELAPRYGAGWAAFQRHRGALDPFGRFATPELVRLLGPVDPAAPDALDYLDRAQRLEPSPMQRHLVAGAPLARIDAHDPPFFVLSRHADVTAALRDVATFSSALGPGVEPTPGGVLGSTDKPDHTRQRRVLAAAFTPSALAGLEARVSEIAAQMLDELVPAGRGDIVAGFAGPFPAIVIAELLGVPAEDRDRFRAWSDDIVAGLGGEDLDRQQEARRALHAYLGALVDARMATLAAGGAATPDVIGRMAAAAHAEGALSRTEMISLALQLLVAGHETTTSLLGLLLYRLIQRPELLAAVRADRTLVPALVEEVLRYDSPVQGLFRTPTHDVELHGGTIPAGTKVQILFAGANRDPERFADPDAIRLDRGVDGTRHVAFGHGIHLCIGAPIARMEARVGLGLLLDRMADIALDGEPELVRPFILRGFRSLPLRWTPVA